MIETIQDFKEYIGQNAENIIASGMNLERKGAKYRCPNKYSHNNGDRSPSMAWDKKLLQFKCFTCNELIDIYGYYTNYKNMSHEEVMKMNQPQLDDYSIKINHEPQEKPDFTLTELKEFQLKYLTESRGLSLETIRAFNLGNVNNNIGIPYKVNGEVVGVKYKTMTPYKAKYMSIAGSEFSLLNIDHLNFDSPLVITEGEFDSMAVYEAGYHNVVSVGTGGSSLDSILKKEGDFLKKFQTLIVFSDDDEVGQTMRKKFLKAFGLMVMFPEQKEYMNLKDANDILLKHGKEQILKLIKSASQKIQGRVNAGDEDIEVDITKVGKRFIPTGIPSIDYAINDLATTQLSLITGRSNSGKSTYVSQIIANAIDKGFKVYLVAGEGTIPTLMNNLYQNVIGGNARYYDIKTLNKRSIKVAKPFVVDALRKWHGDRFTLFSKGQSELNTTEELLAMISREVKIHKHDLVIVDNMMSVLTVDKANEKFEKQGEFIQKLLNIAKTENTHISVVLHPHKEVRKNSSMEMENISGSSDIYNKSDVILSVKRIFDDEEEHDGEISVLKNRDYSDLPTALTMYDDETKMLLEIDDFGNPAKYNLQWEKYLDPKELEKHPEPKFKVDHSKAYMPKAYYPKSKAKETKSKKKRELIDLYPATEEVIEQNPFDAELKQINIEVGEKDEVDIV